MAWQRFTTLTVEETLLPASIWKRHAGSLPAGSLPARALAAAIRSRPKTRRLTIGPFFMADPPLLQAHERVATLPGCFDYMVLTRTKQVLYPVPWEALRCAAHGEERVEEPWYAPPEPMNRAPDVILPEAPSLLPAEAVFGMRVDRLGPIRAEEFEKWSLGEEDPVELIEGWLLPMTPGTYSTGNALGQLFSVLAPLVRERG